LALFVSEKLSKNYEMYLTNTQVSVKNFNNFFSPARIRCPTLYALEEVLDYTRVYYCRLVEKYYITVYKEWKRNKRNDEEPGKVYEEEKAGSDC
jgi:hypothetical protein